MNAFSRIKSLYRDFRIVVNVPTTVFGFTKGNEVLFREYTSKGRPNINQIVAVTRYGSDELEIGQVYYSKSLIDGTSKMMIRLWNNETGDLQRDFDIHGYMIRPSMTSWSARQQIAEPKCCPREGDGGVCKSPVAPCDAGCPYLAQIGHVGAEEKEWEVSRRAWVCDNFCRDGIGVNLGASPCRCGFKAGEKRCALVM